MAYNKNLSFSAWPTRPPPSPLHFPLQECHTALKNKLVMFGRWFPIPEPPPSAPTHPSLGKQLIRDVTSSKCPDHYVSKQANACFNNISLNAYSFKLFPKASILKMAQFQNQRNKARVLSQQGQSTELGDSLLEGGRVEDGRSPGPPAHLENSNLPSPRLLLLRLLWESENKNKQETFVKVLWKY